jgi:sugar O-acyltransferase (sialic acid O-acetyltransferase NeuD family)
MTRPLVILGASGNALDVLDVVDAINAGFPTWEVVGVLADTQSAGDCYGLPVLGKPADADRLRDCWFISAPGGAHTFRQRSPLVAATGVPAERFATLVHPLAAVSPRARLGRGVVVNSTAAVGPNVTVGDHVWLGPGAVVGHDVLIEDHAMVAAGVAVGAGSRLGRGSYFGTGAAVGPHVHVGKGARVRMGAVVLCTVRPRTTVAGNPARPVRHSRLAGRGPSVRVLEELAGGPPPASYSTQMVEEQAG